LPTTHPRKNHGEEGGHWGKPEKYKGTVARCVWIVFSVLSLVVPVLPVVPVVHLFVETIAATFQVSCVAVMAQHADAVPPTMSTIREPDDL
jgi:hypothetical protein